MSGLAIIITGQLRVFFKNNYFIDMYELCNKAYKNIFVICVLNYTDKQDLTILKNFLLKYNIQHHIIDYTNYSQDFEEQVQKKILHPDFLRLKNKYFECFRECHNGVSEVEKWSKEHVMNQFYQIKLGIDYIKNIPFTPDVVFRTRFDCRYLPGFFPHIPQSNDVIDVLSFDEHNKKIITDCMTRLNLKDTTDIINFNKQKRVIPPRCMTDVNCYPITFGGMVCYNYQSLENIDKKIYDNVLYSFNDYYFFSDLKTFLKLSSIFDDSYIKDCKNPDLYCHFYCGESQYLNFYLNNDIDVLMYADYFFNNSLILRN